jgi:hypothetical protein
MKNWNSFCKTSVLARAVFIFSLLLLSIIATGAFAPAAYGQLPCTGATCPATVLLTTNADWMCTTATDSSECLPSSPCGSCQGIIVTNRCNDCCITGITISQDTGGTCFSACQDSVYGKGGICSIGPAAWGQDSSWCNDSGHSRYYTTCTNFNDQNAQLDITVSWDCGGVTGSKTFNARTEGVGPCKLFCNYLGIGTGGCSGFRECGGELYCDSCYNFVDSIADTGCCIDSVVISDDPINPSACFNVCQSGGGKGACNNNPETLKGSGWPYCPRHTGVGGPPIIICRSNDAGIQLFDATFYCSCGIQKVVLTTGY